MTGLSVLTIRYYMDLGLLSPKRTERNWDFSQEDLSRAAAIARYKDCGFSLQTIADLLAFKQNTALSQEESSCRAALLLENERNRIRNSQKELVDSLDKLNAMIRDIEGQVVTDVFNGIPLYLFSQVCCPFCGKPLV